MADTITVTETSYTLTVTPAATQTVTVSTDDQTLTINETAGTTVTVTQPASQTVTVSTSQGIGNHTTDDLAEGSTNLYHTTARASAAAPVQSVTMPTGYTVTDVTGDLTVSVSNATAVRSGIGADNAANLTGNIDAARVSTIPINSFSDVSITKTSDHIVYTTGSAVRARAASNWNLSEFTNDLTIGANDYVSKPSYTNNQVRLFDDFYQCTPDRIDAGLNQWWLMSGGSGVTPGDFVDAAVRGAAQINIGAQNNRRFTFWGAMFVTGADAADGDELVWETRVRLTDNSSTTGALRVGFIDWDSTLNYNDATPVGDGYTGFDFASIAIHLGETNLIIGNKDTGSAGSGTKTDLGSSYPKSSYVDTFVRLGAQVKYNNTDSDWDLTFYINGVSVHTLSMTFSSAIVPYIGMGHGTQTGAHSMEIDWISYQAKQGSPPSGRTTLLDIESI